MYSLLSPGSTGLTVVVDSGRQKVDSRQEVDSTTVNHCQPLVDSDHVCPVSTNVNQCQPLVDRVDRGGGSTGSTGSTEMGGSTGSTVTSNCTLVHVYVHLACTTTACLLAVMCCDFASCYHCETDEGQGRVASNALKISCVVLLCGELPTDSIATPH